MLRAASALIAALALAACQPIPAAEIDDVLLSVEFNRTSDETYSVAITSDVAPRQTVSLQGRDWKVTAATSDGILRIENLVGRQTSDASATDDVTLYAIDLGDRYKWTAPDDLFPGNRFDSAFLPAADGATYDLRLSRYGLIARPSNAAAAEAAVTWDGRD